MLPSDKMIRQKNAPIKWANTVEVPKGPTGTDMRLKADSSIACRSSQGHSAAQSSLDGHAALWP